METNTILPENINCTVGETKKNINGMLFKLKQINQMQRKSYRFFYNYYFCIKIESNLENKNVECTSIIMEINENENNVTDEIKNQNVESTSIMEINEKDNNVTDEIKNNINGMYYIVIIVNNFNRNRIKEIFVHKYMPKHIINF